MKQSLKHFRVLNTVTDYTRFFGLPTPAHPLLTVIDLAKACAHARDENIPPVTTPVVQQFYSIALKRGLKGPLQYGHQSYDFSDGVLFFLAPGQVCCDRPHPGHV